MGTKVLDLRDYVEDLKIVATNCTSRQDTIFRELVNYNRVNDWEIFAKDVKLTITGHSLGGTLAAILCYNLKHGVHDKQPFCFPASNVKSYSFNPGVAVFGTEGNSMWRKIMEDPDQIIAIADGDFVSGIGIRYLSTSCQITQMKSIHIIDGLSIQTKVENGDGLLTTAKKWVLSWWANALPDRIQLHDMPIFFTSKGRETETALTRVQLNRYLELSEIAMRYPEFQSLPSSKQLTLLSFLYDGFPVSPGAFWSQAAMRKNFDSDRDDITDSELITRVNARVVDLLSG